MSKQKYWLAEIRTQERKERTAVYVAQLTAIGTEKAKMVAVALDHYTDNRVGSHKDWVKLRHKLEDEARKIISKGTA
tara:strand:+ start:301 stop:531 length:231 start_codon:yes stop_codon:yes gene_type:complete